MDKFSEVEELLKNIEKINYTRQYWMVRTLGGKHYNNFLRGNYIAIGYNEVPLNLISSLPENNKFAYEQLKEHIKVIYPEKKDNKYAVSQLMKFARNIKSGDIVMIPSESSNLLSFGIVEGNIYEERYISDTDCDFKKRINVKWVLPNKKKHDLHPKLQLLLASQHILSDISKYAVYIDSLMYSFYIKDDEAHLVLRIQTEKEVKLEDFCAINSIALLVDDFCKKNGIAFANGDIIMKIQMESPGWLVLTGKNIYKILLVGLFTIFVNGGGLQYKNKKVEEESELSVTTPGLIKRIGEFIENQADKELVDAAIRAVDSMEISCPEDLEVPEMLLEKRNESKEID